MKLYVYARGNSFELYTALEIPKVSIVSRSKLWEVAIRPVLNELRDVRSMYGNLGSLETLRVIGPRPFGGSRRATCRPEKHYYQHADLEQGSKKKKHIRVVPHGEVFHP